ASDQGLPDGVPVVRAMPNAPATVHEGIAGMCPGAHADEPHLALAEEALQHLGSVVRVPEPYMDAVTAVSGSGPAYFALLSEAMIEAGILLGLGRDVSTQLVIQTMFGTAKLLRDEHMHPVELRERVTSPGGTTIRAVRELEQAWSGAGIWWSDERCVPPDDERSNFGLAQRTLFDRLDAQPGRIHRIRGEDDPGLAAVSYDQELRGTTLDLLLLGLGPDGHVASLFPNSPGLTENERLAIPAEPKLEPFVERVTLTPPALRGARSIVFLVTGAQKAEAVASALGGRPDPAVPGSLIRAGSAQTLAMLDHKAASRLRELTTAGVPYI